MPDAFPTWLVPMAATLTQDRFTGDEWLFERKLDGIRLVAFKQGSSVRLLSRNGLPQDLPAVAHAVASLAPTELVLDGELTWGRSGVAYHVFDVLWYDRSVTALPLEARLALLRALPFTAPLQRVE